MGGNATINGISADRIVIPNAMAREYFLDQVSMIFSLINNVSNYTTGSYLWGKDAIVEDFTAGSTTHLFNLRIPTEELATYKPSFGDIDLQVDKDKAEQVMDTLAAIRTTGELSLSGFHKSVDTVVTLWWHSGLRLNIQVDLELVDFEDGLPTEWSKFCRSSDWDDVKLGIKGFAHKYIFRAMTAIGLRIAQVQMKTKVKTTSITPWVFSPKGLREKYYSSLDGEVWHEIPTSESVFIRDKRVIFEHFFEEIPFPEQLDWMDSYAGVVYLIRNSRCFGKRDHNRIVSGMANLLWGDGAQGIVKDDYKEDLKVKLAAFEYLCGQLDETIETDVHALMVDYYMTKYGVLQDS